MLASNLSMLQFGILLLSSRSQLLPQAVVACLLFVGACRCFAFLAPQLCMPHSVSPVSLLTGLLPFGVPGLALPAHKKKSACWRLLWRERLGGGLVGEWE